MSGFFYALGQLAQFSRQKKLGARMPKKYQHLYLLLLYFVLPQFSLPSSTALATGNFEGWYAGIGPNIGAAASSKGSEKVVNWGIETSVARLGGSDWQGGFLDWSAANGFGGGIELGYSIFGLDVALTQRAGIRPRFILTTGFASLYAGWDQNGKQFGVLFKLAF
jgi:hypothetical protein